MKSAYLYVRVSTDEQKKTGYFLIEQKARLLHHCEINNIKVKGVEYSRVISSDSCKVSVGGMQRNGQKR